MPSSDSAILLDLDGTLIDSQPGILSSCRVALRALGHVPEPMPNLSAIIGPPIDDVMRTLLKPFGDDRVVEAVSAYRLDYGKKGVFESKVYDGIVDALEQMKHAGAQLYVATSKRTVYARQVLDYFGISYLFDEIYGSEPGGTLDHKTELLRHIIERHDLNRDRCIMVGDRCYDIVGAHANQIPALGVLWGYGSRDELERSGVDALVETPDTLPKMALALAGLH